MATQAKVTLSALNGNHTPSVRLLDLTPERRVIQIGRASKNPGKGLLGASDNAWFDSPVMSRNHAEISLSLHKDAITLEDIGSMHGTYVNHDQLKTREVRQLNYGDTIVFGAEVKRGEEMFPACAFKVTYEFSPYKTIKTNTFAYPESSDIEDEDDFEFSDDFGENEAPSSEDETSIESPPFKASQSVNAIDLTRDESPAAYSEVKENINTTNPTQERVMAGPSINTNKDVTLTRLSAETVSATIILDSDEVKESFSFDSDDQSEDAEIVEAGLHSPSESDEIDSEDEESIDVEPIETAKEEASGFELGFFDDHENKPATSPKMLFEVPGQILGRDQDYKEYTDEECESNFGLSEAGRDGLQKLCDDGLLGKVEENPFVKVGKNIVVIGECAPEPTGFSQTSEERKHVTFAGIYEEKEERSNTAESADTPALDPTHLFSFPSVRQPSPSDAAMVKPTAPASRFEVSVKHLPAGEWRQHIAQSLGEKTGKHAFFEARDHNRIAVQAKQLEDVNIASSSPRSTLSSSSSTFEELKRQRVTESATNKVEKRIRNVFGEPMPIDIVSGSIDSTIACAAPLPYLDDPSQAPPVRRSPSPEPDMTSAVSYNESKAAMAAANKTAALFSGRSGLSINDIIDDATPENASKLKRKADDISDVIESELREWASSLPVDLSGGSANLTPTQTVSAQRLRPAIPEITNKQRPTKKIRRFVERLGYATAGGLAVGATLFLGLVATAPDFL